MHAYKLTIQVTESHEVTFRLPRDFPTGEVEVIVLEALRDSPPARATAERRERLSVDELLAARLPRPEGVAPVSLEDIEHAIVEGGLGHGDV